MKRCIVIFLLVLLLAAPCMGVQYYVNSAADGGGDGTTPATSSGDNTHAWDTIAAITDENDGDIISFAGSFREIFDIHSGVTYNSSIVGTKPLLMGSVTYNDVGDWTDETGNIWFATSAVDVGSLFFDSDALIGEKEQTKPELEVQGEFWWDNPNDRVYVYSVGNPATVYNGVIEASIIATMHINADNVIIDGFRIKYSDRNGILVNKSTSLMSNTIIRNCDISLCGGEGVAARGGGGITISAHCDNILVENNTIDNCYDQGISWQNSTNDKSLLNVTIQNNIITNCHYGLEAFWKGIGNTVDNVLFTNNTIVDTGSGFGDTPTNRWADNDPAGLKRFDDESTIGTVRIVNNIFHEVGTDGGLVIFANGDYVSHYEMNNNCYFTTSNNLAEVLTNTAATYTMAQSAAYQSATGQDSNSVFQDPKFIDTTDFHLGSNSPCLGIGRFNEEFPLGRNRYNRFGHRRLP